MGRVNRQRRAAQRYEDFSTEGLIRHRAQAAAQQAASALRSLDPLLRRRKVKTSYLVQLAAAADALNAVCLSAIGDLYLDGERGE